MPRLLLVPHGTPARVALAELVYGARPDHLTPVTVVVPTSLARLAVRHDLARRAPIANVRIERLATVAHFLGSSRVGVPARRPLTPALHAAAVRRVLDDAPGRLEPVAHHPATVRALTATFRDLRRAPADALDRLATAGPGAADTVRLFRAVRTLTAGYYDEEDLLAAAAGALDDGSPAATEVGVVVLHLPTDLSPAAWTLADALARLERLRAVVGVTGDPAADAPARQLADGLATLLGSAHEPVPDPTPPAATSIVHAPDPEGEVREAISTLVTRARAGMPLHRAAVLYRLDDPYARLTRELLEDGGVPWNGPAARRLADTAAGRVVAGAIALADSDLPRDEVAAWLATGVVADPRTGRPVPGVRWDTVSRQAGVVAGPDQWAQRLSRLFWQTAERLDDDRTPARRAAVERDCAQVAALAEFVVDLDRARRPPTEGGWPALTTWVLAILDRYLATPGRAWPEIEVDAVDRVRDGVRELDALGALEDRADLDTLRNALTDLLDAPLHSAGRYGQGVHVGPLRDAVAADLDVVVVLGVAEGEFPPRGRDDPLLPDRDRATAGGAVPLGVDRRAEERRDSLVALAAAPHRVLTVPRADPRAQQRRLPARFVLESARSLEGGTVGAEELLELDRPWMTDVASFEEQVMSREPASVTDHDLAELATWRATGAPIDDHPLVRTNRALAAGFTAIRDRASGRLTPFNGRVGPIPTHHAPDGGRALSPTALEGYATCPLRYLLGRVLRVATVERPEAVESISPSERGTLLHGVLEEFVRTHPRATPTDPWSPAERRALRDVARRHFSDAAARGVTGHDILWDLEQRRMVRLLDRFLDQDARHRRELGVVPDPASLELGFGRDHDSEPAVAVRLADGRTVRFRGVIDRIDVSPDGATAVVLDYKTGKVVSRREVDAGAARGQRLQLSVYARAAQRRTGATTVHACYCYVGETDDRARIGGEVDATADDRFTAVVTTLVDGIAAGRFPARPGDPRERPGHSTWDNCTYCDYDRVCSVRRGHEWAATRTDPELAAYVSLVEPDDSDPS